MPADEQYSKISSSAGLMPARIASALFWMAIPGLISFFVKDWLSVTSNPIMKNKNLLRNLGVLDLFERHIIINILLQILWVLVPAVVGWGLWRARRWAVILGLIISGLAISNLFFVASYVWPRIFIYPIASLTIFTFILLLIALKKIVAKTT